MNDCPYYFFNTVSWRRHELLGYKLLHKANQKKMLVTLQIITIVFTRKCQITKLHE